MIALSRCLNWDWNMIYMILEDIHISERLFAMLLISRFVVEHLACRVAGSFLEGRQ